MYEVSVMRGLPKRGEHFQNTKTGDTYDVIEILPLGVKPPGFAVNANNGKHYLTEAQVLYSKGALTYYRKVDEFMGLRFDEKQKAYVTRFIRTKVL